MQLYIFKNNQQSGPFDEEQVLAQLRSGEVSQDDLGIRQGDTNWTRLGDIFAGRISETPAAVSGIGAAAASTSGRAVASAAPAAKKGGCLKAGLIGTGLILLLLGIATAVGSRFIPSVSCDLAEADARKIEKLERDLDKARKDGDFEKIGPLQLELTNELAGARTTQEYCNNDKLVHNVIGIAGGVVAVFGFLMAVVGLFVGRKK
jgi:hypothetical protein